MIDSSKNKFSMETSYSGREPVIIINRMKIQPMILNAEATRNGIEKQAETGWMKYPIPKDVLIEGMISLNKDQALKVLVQLAKFIAEK